MNEVKNNQKVLKTNLLLIALGLIVFTISSYILTTIIIKKNETYYSKENNLYKQLNVFTSNGAYIFKGEPNNNYVLFNNLLWRIIRVNKTNNIVLMLDKPLNYLPQHIDNSFNIIDYLNKSLLLELDKSKLVKNTICSDTVNDLNKIECNSNTNEYISLLDISTFISSIDSTSFISKDTDSIWLINKYDNNNYWHTSGTSISYGSSSNYYGIKPVITLSNRVICKSGNGTINNPYIIESNNITIGSKIKIDNDLYTVYDTSNDLLLALDKGITNNIKYNSILKYLNTTHLNTLKYKNLLLDNECSEIIINDTITENNSINKICTLNIFDFKFNSNSDYYMLSKINNHYLVYDNKIVYGTDNKKHNLIPTIRISKDNSFKYDGNYYVLER